jgi:hypothetical protein
MVGSDLDFSTLQGKFCAKGQRICHLEKKLRLPARVSEISGSFIAPSISEEGFPYCVSIVCGNSERPCSLFLLFHALGLLIPF